MSADLQKQIGIWRGTPQFNMKTVFIKQNGNFENSQELKSQKNLKIFVRLSFLAEKSWGLPRPNFLFL
jgi:hypothetical protein